MRRSLALISLSGALVAGSAAAVVAMPGLSGAQSAGGAGSRMAGTEQAAGGDHAEHRHGGRGMAGGLDAVASALGSTAEDVRAAMRDGKTLGALADEAGVDRGALARTMVEQAREHLADKVADGRITQEQADERISRLQSGITERMDQPMTGGHGTGDGHATMGGMRHGSHDETGTTGSTGTSFRGGRMTSPDAA